MLKYFKILLIITTFSFAISFIAFSFSELKQIKNVFLSFKNKSISKNYIELNLKEEIVFSPQDELSVWLVSGSIKLVPSSDNKGRISISTQIDKGVKASLNDFFKSDGYSKTLYLNYDDKGLTKIKDKFSKNINFKEIGQLLDDSQSADVIIELPLNINTINLNIVSANVEIKDLDFEKIDVNSISGDTLISKSKSSVLIYNNISGDFKCSYCNSKGVQVNTVSGDILYATDIETTYNIDFSTISGDFKGKEFNDVQGSNKIKINTISGDFNFEKI